MKPEMTNESEFLTEGDLAALLKVSVRTIQRMVRQPCFPAPIRIGRCRRWSKVKVLEYYFGSGPTTEEPDTTGGGTQAANNRS